MSPAPRNPRRGDAAGRGASSEDPVGQGPERTRKASRGTTKRSAKAATRPVAKKVRRATPTLKRRAAEVVARLEDEYPGETRELCALNHGNAFQLLVATILSAQATDAKVNEVTPQVFAAYPEPEDLAAANPEALEALVHQTGFFRSKAKNLIGMAAALRDRFGGEVPSELEDLVTLPGVGRKTGNVIRSVAFGLPGLPVDTHVGRLARRLGLVDTEDPVVAETELNALVAPEERGALSLRLILHGRAVCSARRPACDACVLEDLCPSSALRPRSAHDTAKTPPTGKRSGGLESSSQT